MIKRIKPLVYSLITLAITMLMVYSIHVAIKTGSTNDKVVTSPKEQVSTSQGNFKIYGSREEAIAALNKLTISDADDSDYSGDVRNNLYGGWKSARKSTTRIEVLKDQSENFTVNDKNKITGGTWYIPYTGETVTYQSKEEVSKNIQIDHIVPDMVLLVGMKIREKNSITTMVKVQSGAMETIQMTMRMLAI